MADEPPVKRLAAIGIDVGLNKLATLSTGEGYENQAFLKTALSKLRQANKRLHRRKLGSKNRERARRQVARLHYRITCMRDDVLQRMTTRLANCYGLIGIEDLNLRGLLKNRRLSRSFSNAALGKLRELLTSKVEQRGGQIITIGRFFPSSKTCHCCGWKWEAMTLNDRVFVCQNTECPYYQFPQVRDHNAGQNILREALHLIGLMDQVASGIGSDEGVNAGQASRGKTTKTKARRCRHLRRKQQQRKMVDNYACICFPRLIGAGSNVNRSGRRSGLAALLSALITCMCLLSLSTAPAWAKAGTITSSPSLRTAVTLSASPQDRMATPGSPLRPPSDTSTPGAALPDSLSHSPWAVRSSSLLGRMTTSGSLWSLRMASIA
jgi:hypothetical protein